MLNFRDFLKRSPGFLQTLLEAFYLCLRQNSILALRILQLLRQLGQLVLRYRVLWRICFCGAEDTAAEGGGDGGGKRNSGNNLSSGATAATNGVLRVKNKEGIIRAIQQHGRLDPEQVQTLLYDCLVKDFVFDGTGGNTHMDDYFAQDMDCDRDVGGLGVDTDTQGRHKGHASSQHSTPADKGRRSPRGAAAAAAKMEGEEDRNKPPWVKIIDKTVEDAIRIRSN